MTATYEEGSKIIQQTFKDLDGEVKRFALEIQPVGSSADEIYDILRTKLFSQLPDKNEINEVALAYKDKVEEAKNLGFTNINSDKIYTGIKESYPFHPSIRELYWKIHAN